MPQRQSEHPELQALTGLHLYHGTMSNCSMRVRLLLDEKGLEWTSHVIDPTRQDNLRDDYLRINPTSLIPSLIHDGTIITESNDILYYIEDQLGGPTFVPQEPGRRSAMREWVDLASDLHLPAMKTWLYAKTGSRTKRADDMARYREIQGDPELIAFHQKSLDGFDRDDLEEATRLNHEVLTRMEAALRDGPWLVGERMTLADVAWSPNVLLLDTFGFPTAGYPEVRGWLARVRARPAFRTAIARGPLRLPGWALRLVIRIRRALRRSPGSRGSGARRASSAL